MKCIDNALPERSFAAPTAIQIMEIVTRYKRMANSAEACDSHACRHCIAPHERKVAASMAANEPITFVLPAFPGKSPNLAKVLGVLPDMAETRALRFLDGLCVEISAIYAPGATVILCSDGRVFSDVVGMREEDVTAYQDELDRLIDENGFTNISTFNLDELAIGRSFDELRLELMEEYGKSLAELRANVKRGGQDGATREERDAHRLYCGITKFMFEDSMFPGQTKSRTAVQKESKARAYEVIRRSNAWSELIAEKFPSSVRLSIHPQFCGSSKLGIQLLGKTTWMTPWHGVAVHTGEEFILMKRWEAEKLGSRLVRDAQGRPSYFEVRLTR